MKPPLLMCSDGKRRAGRPGDRVVLKDVMGVRYRRRGEEACIVGWSSVKTNSRGVPVDMPGEYWTVGELSKEHVAVRFANGELDALPKGWLTLLKGGGGAQRHSRFGS